MIKNPQIECSGDDAGRLVGRRAKGGTMKFDVLNRFSGRVQFSAEIDCTDHTPPSIKLGMAVKWAIKADADLARAYLVDAYLVDAYLVDAYLARADLADANLARANLAGANLTGANLTGANLTGANDIIALGYPNGWPAWSYRTKDCIQRVHVGCRDKTIIEARAYWTGQENRREVMAALDYAETVARLRGWLS